MKRCLSSAILCSLFAFGMTGCAKEEKSKSETTITTPGGKTTITNETKVEKSGKNPPPESP